MSRNKKTSESLFQFMNLLIALLVKNGQYRTSLHYKASLNSFKRYRDNKDIALKEIDAEVMRSYEAYLHHTAEVCKNTSSFYLRILRATYNKAVAKGLTPQQHPFSDVYTGIAQTRKRAIPTENVSQIKSLQSVKDLNPKEEMARDTFLMSFYLRGISFIDLAHLRKSDLKDGYLHYTRRKTGQRLTSDGRRRCRSCWKSIRRRPPPHLISFLSLLMMETKDRIKLLTKSRMRHAYITMRKRVSPTTSESLELR